MMKAAVVLQTGMLFILTALASCVVEVDRRHHGYDQDAVPSGGGPTQTAQPVLVEIETDRTMSVDAGHGVGIFIEYSAGGQWRLSLACDTMITGKSCAYDVLATVSSGEFSNVVSRDFLSTDKLETPTAQEIRASTLTATNLVGLDFRTDPGATITLDVAMGGTRDGRFFFFVQEGKVNGGYGGALSNPLMLRPTVP